MLRPKINTEDDEWTAFKKLDAEICYISELNYEFKKAYYDGIEIADTPTAKARWVLIYIHFHIYSKAYETNEFL